MKDLEGREESLKLALHALVEEPAAPPLDWNPLGWTRIQQINFAVTYGLTAIGACLLLGFCTRLAALGGAGFMCFVGDDAARLAGHLSARPPPWSVTPC